jgi:predicted permease
VTRVRGTTESRWHRGVTGVLLAGLPDGRRADVTGDLHEDLHQRRRHRGRLTAEVLFVADAWSLGRAYRRARREDARGAGGGAGRALGRALVSSSRLTALRRSPLFALGAAAPLAIGIATLAGVAGFVDAMLLRPISRVDPGAVFRLTSATALGGERLPFAYPEFELIRPFVEPDAALAAVHLAPVLIRTADVSEQSLAEIVSGSYFPVVASAPLAGRLLAPADDDPGAPAVVVISETLWRTRFGGDARAVGATLFLNNAPFTLVGVVAGGGAVTFAASSTDVWVPLRRADALLDPGWATSGRARILTIIGRAASAGIRDNLAARLGPATVALRARFPDTRLDDRLLVREGRVLVGSQRRAAIGVAMLLGVLAALVFLLVAANVGGLFAARRLTLRRAVAVRRSLGAPASAVMAEAVTEGAAVGAIAGAIGADGYALLRHQLAAIVILPTLTLRLDLPAGVRVTAVIVGLAIASGILLALGPAWSAARLDVAGVLRDGRDGGSGGRSAGRARRWLVAAQVTVALVLVVSAAMLTRSAAGLRAVDAGVDLDRLGIVDLDVIPRVAAGTAPLVARAALEAVRAIPGVEAAAMASGAPVDAVTPSVDVTSRGGALLAPRTTVVTVGDGYFETVGVPILEGRGFRPADATADVAVVNETLAARLGGGAIGQSIVIAPDRALRVIGVARDAKYRSITEGAQPNVYVTAPADFHQSIVVRAAGDPRPLLGQVQRALDGIGPGVQGFFPRTGRDHLGFDLLPTDVAGAAARLVSGVALGLSALALYGLVAWLVEMRRREFGLRLALGATRGDLRRLVLRQALRSATPGVLAGVPAAVGVGVLLQRLLAGVAPPDPRALGIAVAAIAVVVGLAAWLPARRAARVDPGTLLREP